MLLPLTQFRGVAHFVYAKWPRSGSEAWRSAGVIATFWQPRLASCTGLGGRVEVERVVTLPWAQWSSASGFCKSGKCDGVLISVSVVTKIPNDTLPINLARIPVLYPDPAVLDDPARARLIAFRRCVDQATKVS